METITEWDGIITEWIKQKVIKNKLQDRIELIAEWDRTNPKTS